MRTYFWCSYSSLDETRILSIYGRQTSSPRVFPLTMRLHICVALRNPKVMNGDSEQPKWCRDGCLVNVLCQRYLVERSHLVDFREDILATGRLYEVSYVSCRITVWSWAAQVLDDRHIMPTYIIVSNCFRAVMKRSGARQRGKLTTVSPGVVLMQYFVARLIIGTLGSLLDSSLVAFVLISEIVSILLLWGVFSVSTPSRFWLLCWMGSLRSDHNIKGNCQHHLDIGTEHNVRHH